MFDSCFDCHRGEIPRNDRRVLWTVRIVAAGALTAMAGWAGAQLPGAPVLQNAWAMPGTAVAFNLGSGGGSSVYAAAGSWTPSSGRLQLSGGIGSFTPSGGGAAWAYGLRAAVPFGGRDATFGFGAFAGIGGSSAATRSDTTITDTTSTTTTRIPVGLAIGWRHAIGSRGFSLYATPSYVYFSGGGRSTGVMRTGIGADIGITSSIGITGGLELGQTKTAGPGPTGTVYGLGISWAFGSGRR